VFLEAAQAIEDQMRSLVSATQTESDTVSGPVRITSVDTLLNDWVIPRLPALLEAHPHLQIKMIPDNHALSFGRSEADLALRIARPREDAAVLMRRVGAIGMAVYGARTFKATPRERWGELPWLAFNDDLADVPEMKWLQRIVPGAKVRFRCSSMSSLLQACEAGIGIAMLPYFAVRSKTLVRLSSAPEIQREIWLLRHRDASKIRRFRVVAEWIASIAETDRAKLLGQG
jgi:DNA-binding transcriptional LysR family regulator